MPSLACHKDVHAVVCMLTSESAYICSAIWERHPGTHVGAAKRLRVCACVCVGVVSQSLCRPLKSCTNSKPCNFAWANGPIPEPLRLHGHRRRLLHPQGAKCACPTSPNRHVRRAPEPHFPISKHERVLQRQGEMPPFLISLKAAVDQPKVSIITSHSQCGACPVLSAKTVHPGVHEIKS